MEYLLRTRLTWLILLKLNLKKKWGKVLLLSPFSRLGAWDSQRKELCYMHVGRWNQKWTQTVPLPSHMLFITVIHWVLNTVLLVRGMDRLSLMLVIWASLWGNYLEIGNRISRAVKCCGSQRQLYMDSASCKTCTCSQTIQWRYLFDHRICYYHGVQGRHPNPTQEVSQRSWTLGKSLNLSDLSFLILNEGEGLGDLWGPF